MSKPHFANAQASGTIASMQTIFHNFTLALTAGQYVWDVATDWSVTANPSGQWTYGWHSLSQTGEFFKSTRGITDTEGAREWWGTASYGLGIGLYKNVSTTPILGASRLAGRCRP